MASCFYFFSPVVLYLLFFVNAVLLIVNNLPPKNNREACYESHSKGWKGVELLNQYSCECDRC